MVQSLNKVLTLMLWTSGGDTQEPRKRAALWEEWAWDAASTKHWCWTSSPASRNNILSLSQWVQSPERWGQLVNLTKTQSHQRGETNAPVDGRELETSPDRRQRGHSGFNQDRVDKVWTCIQRNDRKWRGDMEVRDNWNARTKTFFPGLREEGGDWSDDTFFRQITEVLRNWENDDTTVTKVLGSFVTRS